MAQNANNTLSDGYVLYLGPDLLLIIFEAKQVKHNATTLLI